jgi:hypothetical protein
MKLLVASMVISAGLLFANPSQAKVPVGATALCTDGSYSHAKSEKGACSSHGGIKNWYATSQPATGKAAAAKPELAPMRSSKPKASTAPDANSTAAAAPMPGVSAVCKDGSNYYGESRKGACSGHSGVKSWYGKTAPSANAPAAATAASPKHEPVAPTPAAASTAPALMSAPARAARAPVAMSTRPPSVGGPGMVWVNTSTKVYHCSNDRWFGRTKRGEYMLEADAKAKGFRPEHGKFCL